MKGDGVLDETCKDMEKVKKFFKKFQTCWDLEKF